MGYQYEYIQSPNYTPKGQTAAFYGRPRTIELGAGHWWGDPNAGYSHQGVINGFVNPARQVAAHLVVSAGRVTQMVNFEDTAWCTAKANPYTIAIEVDPRLHLGGALADQIKQTLMEAIANLIIPKYGDLQWKPHNQLDNSTGTVCNPLDWPSIRAGALAIYQGATTPEWKKNLKQIPDQTLLIKRDGAPLRNLANVTEVIKTYAKGTPMLIAGETRVNGFRYLITQYGFVNGTGQGFDEYELETQAPPQPVVPEWQRNMKDITPVKLTVLVQQTPIVNLNDLSTIKQLGQGTVIDFVKSTTVNGKEYLISSYSATNAQPNGIARTDVGVPAQPPVNDKPEWLKNWEDIADVDMYARADCELVNLVSGATVKVIPRGEKVEIASATYYLGKRYLITKYSTEKQIANGILIDDLDMKPINTEPIEPSPTQPTIDENVNWLVKAVKAILAFFGIKV